MAKVAPWRRIRRFSVVLVLAYLGMLLVLMALENFLIYVGGRAWIEPRDFPHETVELSTSDGVRLTGWHCPCPAEFASRRVAEGIVVLYSHGNAGNISNRAHVARAWQQGIGADVFMYDYRGYGKSEGSPSEAGLYLDGRAAYDWLVDVRNVDPSRIVLLGESLGGGVAVKLAAELPVRALILERTFTSLPDAAARHLPWFPVRTVMRSRFPSLERIGSVACPVFIASADRDEVVPFEHGKTLFDRANDPKKHFVLSGLGHNDPPGQEYFNAVREFLAKHAPQADRRPAADAGLGVESR